MGYRKVYKNRDIRFRCANYDFKSGHCKAECMIYDSYENVEENGQKRVVSIPAWPVGCSGDPNCKNFKEKQPR